MECEIAAAQVGRLWTISLNGQAKDKGASPVNWSGRSGEVFITPTFTADRKSTAAGQMF